MVNAARTHKLLLGIVFLLFAAVAVAVLLANIDDDAWVITIALLLCVPFMAGLQLVMWAIVERGLPKPASKPVTAKELITRLMACNSDDLPFEIQRDGNHLTASWKLADDTWWGLFSREGFQAWYRLELLLDPKRRTVRVIELVKQRELHVDYDDASFQYERFRGWTLFHREHGRSHGLRELFPPDAGEVSRMDLDTRAFRAPILHETAEAGWRILPCTYSLRAGI